MSSRTIMAMQLAVRDWRHEAALSFCAVLALASMLTPLLVMCGVRYGVISGLKSRLLENPSLLIIMPVSSGTNGYAQSFIEELGRRPDVAFAIGRTRDVAAGLQFATADRRFVGVSLEPCEPGEPLLQRYGMPVPDENSMVLSQAAARKLGVAVGDSVRADLGRKRPDGRPESVPLDLRVAGVLPREAVDKVVAFIRLSLLNDIENYRDFVAVARRGFSGNAPPEGERRYNSFRVYARHMDAVEGLDAFFQGRGVEVQTMARDIASVRELDYAVSSVILIIAFAVALGFVAFTFSSVQAAVRRKGKMLGMLRLLGFSRLGLLLYPVTQTVLTGALGTVLAGLVYTGVGYGIDGFFARQLQTGSVCVLPFPYFLGTLGIVLLLSCLASLHAASQAAAIEPSAVLRDV